MTLADLDKFCASLRGSTSVVQWGGAHVWKVGGKVFAICHDHEDMPSITFKAGDTSYEVLKDQPGLRPAPYLASRGLKWIQHYSAPGLPDADLQSYIRQSYTLVARGLPKKQQAALDIAD